MKRTFSNMDSRCRLIVAKEISRIKRGKKNLEGITLVDGPNADNLHDIYADIEGPEDTPYFGGVFRIRLSLPSTYPRNPPKGYVLTPIFHPNVSERGEICVNTLKRDKDWEPKLGISHILMVIRCLLIVPNPESALNEEAGRLLLEDWESFAKRARLFTRIHAKKLQAPPLPPNRSPSTVESSTVSNTAETQRPAVLTANRADHARLRARSSNGEDVSKGGQTENPGDVVKDSDEKGKNEHAAKKSKLAQPARAAFPLRNSTANPVIRHPTTFRGRQQGQHSTSTGAQRINGAGASVGLTAGWPIRSVVTGARRKPKRAVKIKRKTKTLNRL